MILVYHHNDLDGLSSAAIIKHFCKDNTYMRPVNYKQLVPNIEEVSTLDNKYSINTIFIVDYSFTKSTIEQIKNILNKGYNVIWIDHHASSLEVEEELDKYKNLSIYIDTEFCGAINTYKYFIQNEVPYFLKLVDSWDTWKHFDDNDYPFKLFFDTKSYSEVINMFVTLLKSNEDVRKELVNKYINSGKLLVNYIESIYISDRKRIFEVTLNGYRCAVINSSMKSSLLFGDMLDKYDCGISYHYDGNIYSYSIYTTKNDIKVNEIAAIYGGGGHPGAAGFSSTELIF